MTTALAPVAPLAAVSDAVCVALRARLVEVGYGVDLLAETEAVTPLVVQRPRLPIVRWHLARQRTARADLARLFLCADTVPRADVRAALGEDLHAALRDAGVITPAEPTEPAGPGTGDRSPFLLTPLGEGLLVLSDPLSGGADAVMGPGAGTRFVARLMSAALDGAVLDVGCGAGSLALVAAARGARAVGVDINRRSIEVARFNARLNGSRAEFLRGDLTRPVQGRRFDLLVSQPAFVAQAGDAPATTFLHGGAMGDELALRLLAEAPAVLAPGGRAVVFFQSPVRGAGSVTARLREALGEAPADLAVLRLAAPSPALQAMAFAAFEAPDLGAAYDAAAERYLRHFDARGIREIDGLVALLRRHEDAAEVPGGRFAVALPCADPALDAAALDGLWARLDLAGADDSALARARVRVPPGARVVTERRGGDPALPAVASVRFAAGAGVEAELGAGEADQLRALDAAATVDRAIGAHAKARRRSPAQARAEVLAFVRQGLVRGWLAPA